MDWINRIMKINTITYKGYKIRVRCLEWEQVNTLGEIGKFLLSI